ncbi:SCO4848 family membrane protein [Planobispora rosea]|nr:hypothetical protein [Planobispora rosea]
MSRKIAGFLLALAGFMIFEWVNLGFNLADGHPRSFYVVHGILIAVNIGLAIVLAVIGLRGLRGSQASWPPRPARSPQAARPPQAPRASGSPHGLQGGAEESERSPV